jgi:type II secretory pathway component PulF
LTDPKTWSESAALLDVLTTFIREHSIVLLVALIATSTFIVWSMNNFLLMNVRNLLDKIPPWSIYKQYQSTVFLICLSGLIKTGSSYNNAVQFTIKTASPYLNVFLHRMLNNLARGSNFGESLDVGLFKGNMIVNTSIFALTNRLDVGVKLLAEEGLEKQSADIVNQGKVLGYIMMSVVALSIGWIVLAVYSIQATLG